MPKIPTVIDLFAGAGGLSLGAARAGFKLAGAVENDAKALATHKLNFPNCNHSSADISTLNASNLLEELKLEKKDVTGIIGGPPCQGFSTIGRRDIADTRNNLFGHFFRLIDEIRPSFFLAENVPGILNRKYDELRNKAFAQLGGNYTILEPVPIKASKYGAPTTRTRVFFIGYDNKRLDFELTEDDFLPDDDTETIYVKDALVGLPTSISPEWQSKKEGLRKVVKTNGSVFMNKVVGDIPEGMGDPDSLEIYNDQDKVYGCQGTRHLDTVVKRFRELGQGKQDKISKALKLKPDGFCPTLRAGTGSDKGSYQAIRPIHYDEPRVITPREAARLQGFPDWFVFHPTKWHSFRQIGNSVSPIVGEFLLKVLRMKIYPVNEDFV